jgi:penicillin amidase
MLRGWNGVMARTIPQPLILIAWMRALDRRLFADELGPLYARYQGLNSAAIKTVLTQDKAWCDDRSTPATESCGDATSAALADAIAELSGAYGSDLTRWQWGDAHPVRFDHPVLGRVPVIGPLFNVRLPADGGPYTLNRAHINVSNPEAPYASVHGAGYRAVYDLADLDRSRFTVAPGQSGNWFSPHYRDLAELWRDGGSLTIPIEPSADTPVLRLEPARAR